MKRHVAMNFSEKWQVLDVPKLDGLTRHIVVRSQHIPEHAVFPRHKHPWNQLVYAVSGALVVAVTGSRFVIPPEQAVWIPTGTLHSVRSHFGAEFRSLYIADSPSLGMPDVTCVLDVSLLLRALIIEVVDIEQRFEDSAYTERILSLIQDQLMRVNRRPFFLPWPNGRMLQKICEFLYKTPSDVRSLLEWGSELGASSRTLSRQFEREMGISFRAWRYRMRAFKSMELLSTGMSITSVALELGYASPAAFTYMFRKQFGCNPTTYRTREAHTPSPNASVRRVKA